MAPFFWLFMSEKLIYCGSDTIHEHEMEKLGVSEYADGLFVSASCCLLCSVNCPKNPNGYTQIEPTPDLVKRAANPWH